MRNIEVVLAYDGRAYFGWQVQPGKRTVQGELERALKRFLGEPVRTVGASRTDSGVHALDQHASFKVKNPIPKDSFLRALNHHLPDDLRALSLREKTESFSARGSACGKHYVYLLNRGPSRNPFLDGYSWTIERPLNVTAMNDACRLFHGCHSLGSLQSARDFRSHSMVQIYDTEMEEKGRFIYFHILGRSFLYNMVRNMAGALLKVGLGEWSVGQFQENLFSGERKRMGMTAPSRGLHLLHVFYQGETIDFQPGRTAMEEFLGL